MSPANIEAKVKAAEPGDRAGDRDRRHAALQRRPDHARPGRGAGLHEQNGEDAVLAEVERGVAAANEQLARVEQIKRFKVLAEEWEPGRRGADAHDEAEAQADPRRSTPTEIEALYSVDTLGGTGLQAADRRGRGEDRRRSPRRGPVDDEDGDRGLRRDHAPDPRDRRRGRRSGALRGPARRGRARRSSGSCVESPIPVIADIHFNHTLALKAIDAGAHCVRINPGNIGGHEKTARGRRQGPRRRRPDAGGRELRLAAEAPARAGARRTRSRRSSAPPSSTSS